MASRHVTVNLAKKNKFANIFLLMPETGVTDAMRSGMFTEEDIADLQMRCFLQRALPSGSIKGLKAYIAGLLPLPVDPAATAAPPEEVAYRHKRKPPPHPPVDPAAMAPPLEEVVIDSRRNSIVVLVAGHCCNRTQGETQAMESHFLQKEKEKNGRTIYITSQHGSLGCLFQRESPYARSKEDGEATACQAVR